MSGLDATAEAVERCRFLMGLAGLDGQPVGMAGPVAIVAVLGDTVPTMTLSAVLVEGK